MKAYEITVLYAYHTEKEDHRPVFPEQTIPSEKIQVIPVREDDLYHPHKNFLDKISLAEGSYTILLDEGDEFEAAFLERMAAAFETGAALVMPGMRSKRPLGRLGISFLDTSQEVDIDVRAMEKMPTFPTELHGLLIRTELLQEAYRAIEFSSEPEKQILLYLLGQSPVFPYLDTCVLMYTLSREGDYEYDIRCQTPEWYYKPLQEFLLPYLKKHAVTDKNTVFMEHMALYMLKVRMAANIDNRNKHVIPREDVPAYMELFSQVLQYVDFPVLLLPENRPRPVGMTPRTRLLLVRLKRRDFSYYPQFRCTGNDFQLVCENLTFVYSSSLQLRVMLLDYRNGKLEIDGEYNDYFADTDAKVYARFDNQKYSLNYNGRYSRTKCFGVTYARMKTFHVTIPVEPSAKNRVLDFVLEVQRHKYSLEYAFPSHTSRFAKDFGYAYWRFGEYLAYWSKDGIHVVKSSKKKVLKKEIALWLQMWKKKDGFYREQLPLKILNFLLRPYFSRRKIWLFMDKIYKGGDSSEYMYRYAEKQNDGIKKYYLLDKSSADYARMRKEGYRPLARRSLKHRLVFLNADMVVASNSTVFAFNDYTFERSLPIRANVHFDVACVQHGMSVQKIAIAQQRLRDNTRLYFCASKYEIENLSKPVYDYAGYDALKLTGVPRYDGLRNRAQKILVISPTWRMQSALPAFGSEGVSRNYNPNFKETNYFKVYNSLINDVRLLAAARKYGYRIQYVLHPIVSPQHEDFTKNDLVEIIPSIGDMSYEKIFCEGALMVTDFSGVQFDFAYMRKPVIYLHHHDIPQHYDEGTFFYDTMGFGEICRTNDELVSVLCSYMKNDCKMPELYRRRADDFFAFSDNKNCERIYPIMLEHERNRQNP